MKPKKIEIPEFANLYAHMDAWLGSDEAEQKISSILCDFGVRSESNTQKSPDFRHEIAKAILSALRGSK